MLGQIRRMACFLAPPVHQNRNGNTGHRQLQIYLEGVNGPVIDVAM
jgi:hypothetical protein